MHHEGRGREHPEEEKQAPEPTLVLVSAQGTLPKRLVALQLVQSQEREGLTKF